MADLIRDLRHAVRTLRRSPVFAVSAILTLSLAVGANTAVYTVVDRVLLRPLPYPQPERLADVVTHFDRRGDDEGGQTGGTWEALDAGVRTADLAVTSGLSDGVNLFAAGRPQYVTEQRVSAGFFHALGVAPAIGRGFTPDEDRAGGPSAAVLSHALWTRVFGADPAAVGRSVVLRGEPYTVVGVMPAGFVSGTPADVWTPLRPSTRGEGGGQNYEIIARLHPGVTWAQAEAEVASAGQTAMDDQYGRAQLGARLRLEPLQRSRTEDVRRPILLLWAAVGVVLLIGCVNIAGLVMARGVSRAPEIATRVALGGGRGAIVRHLLAESFVLAACGGLLGVALGDAGLRLCVSLLRDGFGVAGGLALDGRVLAVTAAGALATSVGFGLLPALQASRVDLRRTLVDAGSPSIAGRARSWPRRTMVVVEVALGVMLLVGAGLLIRTFDGLMRLRGGFDGTHVTAATVSLQDARYQTSERVQRLFDRSLARIRGIAGVERAAVALTLPYERALNMGWRYAGGGQDHEIINLTYVTPGYFDVLRVPIVRGRGFADADGAGAAPVILVNQAFVRKHSPDADPIGRQLVTGGESRTIVGIVGDIQQKVSFGNYGPVAPTPAAYVPAAQTSGAFFGMVHTWFSPSWVIRTSGDRSDLAAELQRAVQAIDPELLFNQFRTLDDVRGEAVASERAQALLLGALAGLALLLAAVGLYGLVAGSVAERTRELGIRIALGATPARAARAAALPGLALAAAGVSLGLAGARAGAGVMRAVIFGVSATDPLTFGVAAGAVLAVACVAAFVPALRILRLDPMRALRTP